MMKYSMDKIYFSYNYHTRQLLIRIQLDDVMILDMILNMSIHYSLNQIVNHGPTMEFISHVCEMIYIFLMLDGLRLING